MSDKLSNLTAAEIVAIAKIINEKSDEYAAARPQLSPGVYPIDVKLHLKGALNVGKNRMQRMVNKVGVWDLLALALSKLNHATAESLVREYLEMDAEERKEAASAVKSRVQGEIDRLKGISKQECLGQVRPSLLVEGIKVEETAD